MAELVFVYIESSFGDKFLKLLHEYSHGDSVYFYCEMVFRNSALGNLYNELIESTRIKAYSPSEYPTIESQIKRYENLNWKIKILCLNDFFNNNIEEQEKKRVIELEGFKDPKELGIFLSHVIIGFCYKNEQNLSKVLSLFSERPSNFQNKSVYDIPFGNDFDPTIEIDTSYFRNMSIGGYTLDRVIGESIDKTVLDTILDDVLYRK